MESPARKAPRAQTLINHSLDAVACLHRRREVRVRRVRWTCARRARAMGLADSRHQAGHLGGAADRRRALHRDHRRVSPRLWTRRPHRATGGRGPGRSAGPDRASRTFRRRTRFESAVHPRDRRSGARDPDAPGSRHALRSRFGSPRWAVNIRRLDGQVIAPIQAGGYGQITMRDAMGYPLSAGATAETDIAQGTPVRVVGTKGLELVVAPIPPTGSSDTNTMQPTGG